VFQTGKKNHPIGESKHFESVFPNSEVSAKGGAEGKDLMDAMILDLNDIQTKERQGLSAESQHRGAHPMAKSGDEDRRAECHSQMTCERDCKFQSQLLGVICLVCWNINDVFNGQVVIEVETHEEYQRLLMHIFSLALEMGVLAKRYPHSSFAISGCAATWKAPEQFDVFASAARLGIAMTGSNVASGVRDYAAVEHLLSIDRGHYKNNADAVVAFAGWLEHQAEYAFVIQDGTHILPHQYIGNGDGPALVAADASGRRLTAGDSCGMGQPLTNISPPRWEEAHPGRTPPTEWAWRVGNPKSQGQPQDVIFATTPWSFRPGGALHHKAVEIECEELKTHSLTPRWLIEKGLIEMSEGWTRAGLVAHLAGLNGGEQMVAHHLSSVCMAQNVKCHGFPGRVIACVKTAWNLRQMPYLRWPGLEDVDVHAIPLKSGPKVPVW
jgi:hypothetical protein